jgi:hypothetical protein
MKKLTNLILKGGIINKINIINPYSFQLSSNFVKVNGKNFANASKKKKGMISD